MTSWGNDKFTHCVLYISVKNKGITTWKVQRKRVHIFCVVLQLGVSTAWTTSSGVDCTCRSGNETSNMRKSFEMFMFFLWYAIVPVTGALDTLVRFLLILTLTVNTNKVYASVYNLLCNCVYKCPHVYICVDVADCMQMGMYIQRRNDDSLIKSNKRKYRLVMLCSSRWSIIVIAESCKLFLRQ